ncbi:MAG: molecular chaperone DnaJ [Candidatus Margulisiibacteriota bacterium]|nr:MAG: molecular chaperone DnaJ [Candidatus Margulisbacteria bacterium GWD2_39_127]OGI02092.1 MAG: molecular chaperone DnaJ [Candidatus Margulisbacteria bacterium GWF2_38_17]OGI10469.1 MAG: molecular chaperone DnaJ [Candidatus Margulisbacteria bacterium GWE2_39_32]PZM79985.1 MAG: molecular chaperone DnaJ [Candidatus Margulisiibacteriota bacterium]HAR62452.1 molecular chaperone DnaJ [Candidatus Margulisiibacteriota bacterium]
MAKTDYYEVLGIPKDASESDIKKAYRKLARQFHPDVNKSPDSSHKFKEINEAYETLADPKKRSQYDQYGHVDESAGQGFGGGYGGFEGFGGFEDIFESFFGGTSARRTRRETGPRRGDDLRYDLSITLEEAATGIEREIDIFNYQTCATCAGSGARPGTKQATCPTCGGSGEVQQVQRTILGSFTQVTTCPNCGGKGKVISNPCATCGGSGREKKKQTVKVRIPAGVDTGAKLRVSGAGNTGANGGPPGDLYIFISVKTHPVFAREGDDISTSVKISFAQAALGDEIEVPTLSGPVGLKVPPGTQSHTTFRIKGKGIPHLHARGIGDEHVLVKIVTPTYLNQEESDIMEYFAHLQGVNLKKQKNTKLFEKIKKALKDQFGVAIF